MGCMIDASRLLKQFLGAGDGAGGYHRPPAPASTPGGLEGIVGAARQVLGQAGGAGGFAGGAVAGGLLGLLLGGKKMSKGLGGVLSHGGAAMLGAMAHRAYQNWQEGQTPSAATVAATPQDAAAVEPRFLPAADGQAFELVLVRAMIAAAKADGHIDTAEQRRIFQHVEEQGLDAEAKAFVFDALSGPVGVTEIAAAARTPEQSAELYLASRLAIDPDQPAERAYLDALAHRLSLPPGLAAHLDRQVEAILPLAAGDEDLARPSPPQ
jgi:uncharacterized membrane protein YebE (DUF533 family)